MRLNPKYIQIFGDAVIPLLGFFIWNWSLYFILLFYFLDLLANEGIIHLKSRRTAIFQQKPEQTRKWIIWGMLSLTALIVALAMVHFAMIFIVPDINFFQEMRGFWNYEEMGIKQGYVLVPLILIVSFQQYRTTFLLSAKYRTARVGQLWKTHVQALIVIIAFAGVHLSLGYFYQFSEMVYVLSIVVVSTLYKLRFSE